MASNRNSTVKVIVLGGGVAGMEFLREMAGNRSIEATLIDPSPVHVWKPGLHEFAVGELTREKHTNSFEELAKTYRFDYVQGTIDSVDRKNQKVILKDGESHSYDYLIAAFGASPNDFGIKGVKEHAWFLNSIDDAEKIYDRLCGVAKEARFKEKPLKLAVIGGGATGVQLAAELWAMFDERGIKEGYAKVEISLIEGMSRLLGGFAEQVGNQAVKQLEDLGIKTYLNAIVEEVKPLAVQLKDGASIDADVVIWAAGVKVNKVADLLGDLERGKGGALAVSQTLQSQDPLIFAIGDCAFIKDAPLAPTAQAARQEGQYIAKKVLPALIKGVSPKEFTYNDLGAVVTLSHYNAWGQWPSGAAYGGRGMGARLARLVHEGLFRREQYEMSGIMDAINGAFAQRFCRRHKKSD